MGAHIKGQCEHYPPMSHVAECQGKTSLWKAKSCHGISREEHLLSSAIFEHMFYMYTNPLICRVDLETFHTESV